MDSSSDSDEFYECDELDDKQTEMVTEVRSNVQLKQVLPAAQRIPKGENVEEISKLSIAKAPAPENNNISTSTHKSLDNKEQNLKQDHKIDQTADNNNVVNIMTKIDSISKCDINEDKVSEGIVNVNVKKLESGGCLTELPDQSKTQNVSTEKLQEFQSQLQEEISDIWGDDNWNDYAANKSLETSTEVMNNNTKFTEPMLYNKTVQMEGKNFEKASINASLVSKTEENLWDEDNDWGRIEETKLAPQPEDDLWGDGDGWGVETPQDTHKKENVSEEADLWAEGDNWSVDNTTFSHTSQTKSTMDAKSALDSLATSSNHEESSWGGWSTWGLSSVLSTAANITTTVSQGLTTVLETGIGIPDPAELAKIHQAEEAQRRQAGEDISQENEDLYDENFVPFGLGNFVPVASKIGKLVESTGTKVINRGLGTLETIGKKTYEVLQENDPQLKKKRALLKCLEGEKPVLSAILREAKDQAEAENKDREQRHFAKKANYETMFDDYTGLVHLEALEMLSKQCGYKLETILSQSKDITEVQETMEQIKDLCELDTGDDDEDKHDIDELKSKMSTAIEEINIRITCEKVLETFEDVTTWIETTTSINPNEWHSNAIENLAKITAMAVEQYHKAAELLLVKEHRSTADEADSLVQLTNAITALLSLLSTKYTVKLKGFATADTNDIKNLISNIYLEAANSSRYVEDAFSLLIPVIQVGAV